MYTVSLAQISVYLYCAVCSVLFNSDNRICIWPRWEGPVQNSLSSPSAPLIFFSLSLWPLYVLPDWPSWFNDLAQTGHSDRMGEKESEKVNGSQMLKPAEWDSLLLTDQNSPILSLRFIFYFLHLFVTVSAIHSSLLLWCSHSFQPVTQNTCPIPSLHSKWSSLPLPSSVLVFRVDLKGVADIPSEKAWQRSQKILYQTETLVHAHKHTSAEHSSFFVIPTKLMQPKSWWCPSDV